MSEEEAKIVEKYVKDNLAKGWIVPSSFEYASPILFVRKANRALRLYVDYRGLNKVTKKDSYPLPLIDEIIARVIKVRYYTKFNIEAAFNNLYMATDRDADLTTFVTRYSNYKSLVLLFGLSVGPAHFQRFINDKFLDMLDKFVSIYVDDILVYSNSRKEHEEHVRVVLQRLRELNL